MSEQVLISLFQTITTALVGAVCWIVKMQWTSIQKLTDKLDGFLLDISQRVARLEGQTS